MIHEMKLDANLLARKERIQPGFFSTCTDVDIPQGVNAVVWEKGQNCGEIGAGRHRMSTFLDRLFLKSDKEQVIYAVNSAFFPISYSGKFLTKECVAVDCTVSVDYTVENRFLFLSNLFGPRETYTKEEFNADTQEIVLAAIRDSIVKYGVKELADEEFRQYFVTTLDSAITTVLGRYGIRFHEARIVSLSWEGMDTQNESRSRIWMTKEGQAIRKEEWEAETQARLDEISHEEKVNDLDMLAKQTSADRQDAELTLARRKVEQQKTLRQIVQSQEFDKITTEAEMEQFLFEQEKAGLLRENERKELLKEMEKQNIEADKRRDFLLAQLDIQMERQLETEKNEYIFRSRMTALEQEEALARKVASMENEAWLRFVQEEKAKRIEEKTSLVEQLGIEQAFTELELEKANRQLRFDRIDAERAALELDTQLASRKRMEELEIEIQNRTWTDQIEKMAALNRLNREQQQFDLEVWERKTKLEAEIERTKTLDAQKFELDRLRVLQTFGKDAVLSMLTPEQAAVYASVNAPAGTQTADAARLEVLQKAKDEQAAMMQDFMQMQERMMGQFIQNMAASNGNQAPVQPVIVTGTGQPVYGGAAVPGSTPAEPKRVVICPGCRAEVQENAKFCLNCGKEL